MNKREATEIAEVLESYFEPDPPEGLACAMQQLKDIYDASTKTQIPKRRRIRKSVIHTHLAKCGNEGKKQAP